MATRLVSLVSKGRLLGRLGNPAAKQQKRGAISHGPDIFAKGHDKFWSDYENYYRKVCALGFIFWPLSVFISLELDEVMESTREDFVPYVHMRIRTKPLPYGDGVRSLLHDPYFNAVPGEGYETDYNPHAHHHDEH